MEQGQDPVVLREQEYVDDRHLDVRRQTHVLYTVDPVDFGRWTLDRLDWRGDERVLDAGCGPGEMLCAMARQYDGWGALVGFDFSPGMIAEARAQAAGLPVHVFVADAQAVPLPDATFDVVMARHMLYHVPEVDRALAETARLLRPGGHFLATTNSAATMPEYTALRQRAAERFPSMAAAEMITERFSLESAPGHLAPHFGGAETHVLRGTLRFPAAQPLVDYFASARAMTMAPAHTEEEWQAVLAFVRAEAEAVIARHGHFDVTKITGAVVGLKAG
jgi:SAM-dependent methyltransferase